MLVLVVHTVRSFKFSYDDGTPAVHKDATTALLASELTSARARCHSSHLEQSLYSGSFVNTIQFCVIMKECPQHVSAKQRS